MGWRLRDLWRADRSYFEGTRLLRSGKPGEAVRAFDTVLALYPRHARARLQRAKALAAGGRTGEAVRSAKRAAELAPSNHAPMLALGQIQYDAGQLEEARKSFSAAARVDPENRLIQAYLGLSLLALGRIEEGSALLDAHLLFGYEGLEARLLTLAEQYLWQHKEAARSLDEQLAPEEGVREEGPAGFGLQFASAVRRILLWPLARLRGRAGVSRLEAEEAFSTREWDKAIAALHRAEEANADPEDTAAALGMAYLEAHKPEAAAGHLLRLPEEVRSEPDIALALGVALFDSGRHEEAKGPLQIASERFTRDFLPPYLRGLCEIAVGQQKAATRWFLQSAERLNPQLARKRFEEMMRIRAGEGRD